MANTYHFNFGLSFPPAMVVMGYVLFIAGFFSLFAGALIATTILCPLGGLIAFTTSGIHINPKNKAFKKYSKYFGIESGKWESYESYPYISLIRTMKSTTAHSRANVSLKTSEDIFFDIILLSQSHRKKLLIKRLKDKEQAQFDAKSMANKLGLEYAVYNPKPSSRTRARRERRR